VRVCTIPPCQRTSIKATLLSVPGPKCKRGSLEDKSLTLVITAWKIQPDGVVNPLQKYGERQRALTQRPSAFATKKSPIRKEFTLLPWVGGRLWFNCIIGAPGRIQFFQGLCISMGKSPNQFGRLARLVVVPGPCIGIAHQ
jgi:hypothetical protein